MSTNRPRRGKTVRLGAGAGFARDRIEPALELAERGQLDYLVFECLAERTIALAQQEKRLRPDRGYDPMLEARIRAVLPALGRNGFRIVTNMGAAHPRAAARATLAIAKELGLSHLKVAVVEGDDVLETVRGRALRFLESARPLKELENCLIAANAYLGVDGICQALAREADIVICGRVSDPALFLGPLVHEFGWSMTDWDMLAAGTLAGHMLECAGQVSGGYFADPGYKNIDGLDRLGFPIGEVSADGAVVVTKLEGTGGRISAATCKEQLLYEIHDPACYLQPDVVADFSAVRVEELGMDRVRIHGARGRPRPPELKVSVAYHDGYVGEAQISYAGTGAVARARLAAEVVRRRIAQSELAAREHRLDLIGVDALHLAAADRAHPPPYEARLRVAARTATREQAEALGREVESLYTNGPAGGGGVTLAAREIIAVQSVLLPRELVAASVTLLEHE